MDPITCTMGVVMFVFLMVVLFGRPPGTVPLADAAGTERARTLREERDELNARVAALPPAGDPALAARWSAALERIKVDRVARDGLEHAILQRTILAASERAEADAEQARVQAMVERARTLQTRKASDSSFVRVSRFQPDGRRAAILALSGGLVSRPMVTAETKTLAPPVRGDALGDAVQTRAVLTALLHDCPPSTCRVELAVWSDSFAQAKVVEQVLLEMGYDTNPLPVQVGASLAPGTGGVQ